LWKFEERKKIVETESAQAHELERLKIEKNAETERNSEGNGPRSSADPDKPA